MKKFLSICLLAFVVVSYVRAEDEATTQRMLTTEEQEVFQRFYEKLGECYKDITARPEIAEAFQEVARALQQVADSNREDFEMIRDLTGAQLQDGTPALPINIPMALQ